MNSYFLVDAANHFGIDFEGLKQYENRTDGLYRYNNALEAVEKNMAVWEEKMSFAEELAHAAFLVEAAQESGFVIKTLAEPRSKMPTMKDFSQQTGTA